VCRGYLERMKRDTGARIICASLFFPFSWILLNIRDVPDFSSISDTEQHTRVPISLSLFSFFLFQTSRWKINPRKVVVVVVVYYA
jgi:hypothetical protein